MKKEFGIKNIFGLSVPAALSYATVVAVGLIDLFFIGKLGIVSIAAAGIGVATIAALCSFLEGLRTSITVLTAQFFGADSQKDISRIFIYSIFSAFVLGALFFLLATPVSKLVFFLTKDLAMKKIGFDYLRVRIAGLFFTLIILSITGFFRGLHNTRVSLYVSAVVCISNFFLDYAFVLGRLGAPAWGGQGSSRCNGYCRGHWCIGEHCFCYSK